MALSVSIACYFYQLQLLLFSGAFTSCFSQQILNMEARSTGGARLSFLSALPHLRFLVCGVLCHLCLSMQVQTTQCGSISIHQESKLPRVHAWTFYFNVNRRSSQGQSPYSIQTETSSAQPIQNYKGPNFRQAKRKGNAMYLTCSL